MKNGIKDAGSTAQHSRTYYWKVISTYIFIFCCIYLHRSAMDHVYVSYILIVHYFYQSQQSQQSSFTSFTSNTSASSDRQLSIFYFDFTTNFDFHFKGTVHQMYECVSEVLLHLERLSGILRRKITEKLFPCVTHQSPHVHCSKSPRALLKVTTGTAKSHPGHC